MKHFILSTLCLFVMNWGLSQNQRFTYEYKFAVDSTKKDSLISEIMNLDVYKEKSVFYSRIKQENDSIINQEFKKQSQISSDKIINLSHLKDMKRAKVNDWVLKTYPNYEVELYTKIGFDDYAVRDERKMQWKIAPEHETFKNWKVQKATTEFAGRKWTAWFTTDIPIPDGPYKFHGLPGLIVKMEDQKKMFSFELVGSKKINDTQKAIFTDKLINLAKIDRKQFKKAFQENRSDPAKSLRMMGGNVILKASINGKEVSQSELIKKMEKSAKEKMKRENSFIEQDWIE
ncbi:GLPGLI family protein [Riemerella anatipestifer]|uniref:GLPGLI family protein n=2 Tax=Riemerella anatipestifer TaxID=34085 RepID=UPI00129DEA21|nr:GLPGLI family protein [Riemerella anatipestifer]MDD1538083.1 GLPGLI family protein [Riemerella anatipestifer]MRM95945.1 GLPGLI family protein [Riemerella anatipestifer]MRM99622.1 GLPGLI family protein [Riemerella anatipestifer]MRN03514.1 GLPGLI family protein [Riemerella anatipestifer]MRN16984.1 GLPGLI family protein [Riemerella anatipestifer]